MTHPASARDPLRFVEAVLANPSHVLPLPERDGRAFLAEGETVDAHHPFYAALLADRSLVLKPATLPDAPEPEQPDPAPIGDDRVDGGQL